MGHSQDAFPVHVRAFSELLVVLRDELDNDLDQGLILAVIAERHYAALRQQARNDGAESEEGAAHAGYGINAYSVSLYTDIPRETVRRKIKKLIAKGWLVCDAKGNLAPTGQAAKDLKKSTDATLRYIRAVSALQQGKD